MIWAEFLCSFAESGREKASTSCVPGWNENQEPPVPPQLEKFSHLPGKPEVILIPFSQGRRKGSTGTGWNPTGPIVVLTAKKIKYKYIFSTVIQEICPVRQEQQSCWKGESAPQESVWKEEREKSIPTGQWGLSAKVTAEKESSQKGGFKSQWHQLKDTQPCSAEVLNRTCTKDPKEMAIRQPYQNTHFYLFFFYYFCPGYRCPRTIMKSF